jgi:chemotaxis protein MotB
MAVTRRRHPVTEDESYFVSMTDLMIGLLFIFIIMLMSFAINFREAETKSREEEEKSRALQVEQDHTIRRLTDNQDTLEHILRSLEQSLLARGIVVRVDPHRGILRLPEDILFDSGSATLSAGGRQAVAALAEALEAIVPCHAVVPGAAAAACDADRHGRIEALLIEGHTDDVPLRPRPNSRFHNNWELSAARAIATYDELDRRSLITLARNDRGETLIGVGGYGEERPTASNASEEGRRANRRIDLRFLMAAPERSLARPPELPR